MQLSHHEHLPPSHGKEIIIVCDHLIGPANMGSIFRISDAFGVQEIIFCGSQPDLKSNRLRRTARNSENQVRFRESDNLLDTIKTLEEDGYENYALEISSTSVGLETIDFSRVEKIAIIIGNERHGISAQALENVKKVVHISMFGINSSMNVAQATGIALYEITRV